MIRSILTCLLLENRRIPAGLLVVLGGIVVGLALPQIPMTLGNAVIAYADLSGEYFGQSSKKVSYRSACISIAIANFMSFLVGGMPLCHGAGGLAAHYRFGARTAGSNLMVGLIFVALAIFLGAHALSVL